MPPVNQTKQTKMKNLFSFAAIAALTMLATSCGNGDAEAKRKADSAHMADSVAMITMQWRADSAHMADSVRMAMESAEMMRKADSARMADSMANLKPGKKAKTPEQKKKEETKKAVGGRG